MLVNGVEKMGAIQFGGEFLSHGGDHKVAEFTEKKALKNNAQNLCELGVLCGKFPYQHSTGVLSNGSPGFKLMGG